MNFKDDEHLKFLIENAPIGICILDAATLNIEMLNDKFLEITGTPKETLLGKWYWEPFAEARPYYEAALNEVVLTGETYYADEAELRLIRNGREEWIFVSFVYTPLKDTAGQVTKVAVWVLDNTQQVKVRQAIDQMNEELVAANEEVIAANEELAATNEELTETQHTLQQAYELSDQQKRVYETVTSSTPDLMYVFGLDYRFTYANSALLTMWGKTWDNAIGKSLLENGYEPWHAEMHEREIDTVKATKQFIRGDVSFPHAILGRRVYDYILTPVINEQGEVEAVAGTTRDVTERKKWEESLAHTSEELQAANEELAATNEELISTNEQLTVMQQSLETTVELLKHSRRRFQNLVREASIGIIVLMGEEMRVEIVNKTYGKLIDRSVDELLGSKLFDIIPETEGTFRPIIEKVRITGKTQYLYDTLYVVYSEGKKIEGYLNLVYQPYVEDDRSVTGVIILCQDVTEQVQAKISMKNAYEQLRLSKEAAQLGFFDMDLIKGTLEWDTRCRELFGISHTDAVTYEKDFVAGLFPEDRDRILSIVNNVLIKSVSNGIYDVDYRTVGAEDQQIKWIRAKGQVYFDQDDKPVRFIGSVLDITEQKQDEIRKNDFIGMVSHELKTPLTSLNAYLQMLQGKANNAGDTFTSGALVQSLKQVKRMTTMINGFLNVSRLESSKINIDKQAFDMAELVKESEAETIPMYSSHQIVFAPVEKTIVLADRDKIGQVINNFISNAVKYSKAGSAVNVACVTVDQSAVVSVKDEGIGIDKKEIDKLFDRYYRVEGNNHISGFGIGLYLCFEIIERHHGKIWVESEPGKGSTFFFSIPVQPIAGVITAS